MKKWILTISSAVVLMFSASPLLAQNVVENFENGKIDWSNGVIEAVGIGAPPANPINMAQARAMAKRAAVIVARRNLLEVVNGVRIDSKTLVKNFMVESDVVRAEVQGVLQHSQVVDISYMSDGSVEATVAMPLTGALTDLVLPKTKGKPEGPTPQETPGRPAKGVTYTGLVVDARGFRVKPAMSPRILDEDGNEVYGSASVSREYAVQQGMAGYAKDLSAAKKNERVTDNPITVKGLRAASSGQTDIIISNEDATLIRSAAQESSFLEKCRVMIVLN
ncbi:MAG: LPP20 family lipoprotein [Deltaproteobacteria bacterium]|nr:LPP20 family lipoprotein [Deltaproteobacteria bacterium]MBW1948594.1 LPP20 family lipoprotein [Deltaproteobacteria bacterium]MBW2007957.1 LPP20 family lipoprotein [Deltaproteobacteria bacterium]MBW2102406.1 LPP20 family lipoprotein [Deltaproteobacteria bacterium]MBW2347974.1 LPP20 family lipoprotein [Deltaproteobacteria bacterium]